MVSCDKCIPFSSPARYVLSIYLDSSGPQQHQPVADIHKPNKKDNENEARIYVYTEQNYVHDFGRLHGAKMEKRRKGWGKKTEQKKINLSAATPTEYWGT